MDWNCALITGGAKGLGKAFAQSLVNQNKMVYIVDCDKNALIETVDEIGAAGYFVFDLANVSELAEFSETVLKAVPEIDCLINNAGIQMPLDFVEGADLSAATKEINTNVMSLVHLCGLFVPHLVKKRACIMNFSSGLAYVPASFAPVYSASMASAFIKSFTVSLRDQLRSTNVKVIEIAPPLVQSNLHQHRDTKFKEFVTSNNITQLTQEEWISALEKGLEEGSEEVGAGFSQLCIDKWKETFGPIHAKLSSVKPK
ncbi:hypothetical protein RhiTH_003089 [Rhizoctonia solani]|uniref:Sepiapterin reductase n=1 Tax=Rhizoctonia solani TaxID=456999 RepID=A0A8H7IMQ4_9AGAM